MKKIIILILTGIALVGCERTGKVGDYEYSHFVMTGRFHEDVFRIITESGEEKLVLERYLEESINTYKQNGTYGKKVVLK